MKLKWLLITTCAYHIQIFHTLVRTIFITHWLSLLSTVREIQCVSVQIPSLREKGLFGVLHNVQAGYFDGKWDDFLLLFTPFFSPLFRIDFWLCSLHQNDTRVTNIKSYDTQEPSGEVSPDLAVPLVHLDVAKSVDNFFQISLFILKEMREICKDSKEARATLYPRSF